MSELSGVRITYCPNYTYFTVLSKCSSRFEIKKQEKQLSKKEIKPHFEQIYMDVRKYLELKDVKTDSEAYIPGSENVDPTFVYSFYPVSYTHLTLPTILRV